MSWVSELERREVYRRWLEDYCACGHQRIDHYLRERNCRKCECHAFRPHYP